MNIKGLRQHYFRRGNKWIPKRPFASPDDALETTGEITFNQDIYLCDVCGLYHRGRIKKRAVA